VIVDAAGTVLTNHHVVESAGAMSVKTADGRRLEVRRVASDAHSDLAVLELERQPAEPLPAPRLGDSRAMRIGDWVLTIGSPLDLGPSVSAGIISATDRIPNGAGQVPLLQTDAAVNPGSSGGALVNLAGELVGITTAIASRDGGFQGIGFAIPAETAQWVTSQLREHGTVRWPDVGVSQRRPAETVADPSDETPEPSPETVVYSVELQLAVADLGAAPAADHGPRSGRGVRVVRIDADGPAFHAGLREAMNILRVGDRVIENLDDFSEALENASIEDGIVLGIQDPEGTRDIRVAAPQ
ncbi:MAG: trypsin-like peptidase domain-containing protein, partial [Kosmotogaceae bacterium]